MSAESDALPGLAALAAAIDRHTAMMERLAREDAERRRWCQCERCRGERVREYWSRIGD